MASQNRVDPWGRIFESRERWVRNRLTECQAGRANAGTLMSRQVHSGAEAAQRWDGRIPDEVSDDIRMRYVKYLDKMKKKQAKP